MASERRGLPSVRTIRAVLDNRRARTAGGAYLELSSMANERTILVREIERWKRRRVEIQTRLDEIDRKQARLLAVTRAEEEKSGLSTTASDQPPREQKVRLKSAGTFRTEPTPNLTTHRAPSRS